MPDVLTVLFTPRGVQPLKGTNANAVLVKSSARREKHDVWGNDFILVTGDGDDADSFTADAIHLVAHIEKVHVESVEITLI